MTRSGGGVGELVFCVVHVSRRVPLHVSRIGGAAAAAADLWLT